MLLRQFPPGGGAATTFAQAKARCATGDDFCRLDLRALPVGPATCLEYEGADNVLFTDSLRVYRCQLPLPGLEVRYGCTPRECVAIEPVLTKLRRIE